MRRISLTWIYVFCGMVLTAQPAELQQVFDKSLSLPELKHAAVSCAVFDMDANKLVAELNPDMALIPASSLKLLTTLSAIHLLGEDFKYKTRISYRGNLLDDGTLEGDIFIEGSGDPCLGTSDFETVLNFQDLLQSIVGAIKNAGINCVDGDIIADESIFNSFPVNPTWQWNDLGNYYAAGAWGINILENEYHVYFQQSNIIGATPQIHHYNPHIPGLELQNEVETDSVGTGDNAYIFGGPYNYQKRIVGTIPAGEKLFRIKGSIPDPPLFFAHYLQNALAEEGIQSRHIDCHYFKKKTNARKSIYEVLSPSLFDLARKANFESNNLYCESMLKRLGKEKMEEGSGEMGKRVIRRWLMKKQIPLGGLHMMDGSGLSARNSMSSYFMVRFLDMISDQLGWKKLSSLIPKAGYQGTVRGLLSGRPSRGHVWVKSGSMERVLSYSGVIKSKSGKTFAFCLMSNGHNVKNKQLSKWMEQLINSIYVLG